MEDLPKAEEWLANANDAINISLVAPSRSGLQNVATFNPKFTYSIFGDEEQIFGYKDLKISLRYRANDMRPHLKISQSRKFKEIGDEKPTDIAGILEGGNHLPKIAFAKENDFVDSSTQISDTWTPPGTLHSTIEGADGTYEIWRGSLADPAVRQMSSRLQIFVPLFIEGGSYISDSPEIDPTEADRWTVFLLFKKQPQAEDKEKSSYLFVGFSTVYRFFYFQTPTPPASPRDDWELPTGDLEMTQLPCRTRLSQFVILPPYQGTGNGARLYQTIFEHYHKHAQTREFTVEDPNEAFDDLRDVCDLQFLRAMPEFKDLSIDTKIKLPKTGPIPQLIAGGDSLESIRQSAKIAPRQFSRVLEMHLMSQLPLSVRPSMSLDDDPPAPTKADKHQERLWQLVVKQRLYRHNRDILSQIELGERIEKLQQTLGGVELEYARILAACDRASKHSGPVAAQSNGKRKHEDNGEGPSKKARVEDA